MEKPNITMLVGTMTTVLGLMQKPISYNNHCDIAILPLKFVITVMERRFVFLAI